MCRPVAVRSLLFSILLTFLSIARLGQAQSEPSIFGALWSSVIRWGFLGPDPLLARTTAGMRFPAAPITTRFAYGVTEQGKIQARLWQFPIRGTIVAESDVMPGFNTSAPILSTELQLGGAPVSQAVFFLNTKDGYLYSFDASVAEGVMTQVWKSDFMCSNRTGQEMQMLSVNSKTDMVIAQCYDDLVVANMTTGAFIARIRNRQADPYTPLTYVSDNTVVVSRGNKVIALSLGRVGLVPWTCTVPDSNYNISDLVAHPETTKGVLAVTGENSPTIYFFSSVGRPLANISVTMEMPNLVNVSVLPTPTILSGVLYGIVTGVQIDPFEEFPPVTMWSIFAVNLTEPAAPTLLWQYMIRQGSPPPQKIQLSKRFMYVNLPGNRQFRGHSRENGTLAWFNSNFGSRLPTSWNRMSLMSTTYCCENMLVAGADSSSNYTMAAFFIMLSQSSIDGNTCTCET